MSARQQDTVSPFRVRGFMLDISRGRVPNRATLKRLVKLLARCDYNQLQLYMEHTFAYRDHKVVWQEAAPLFPEDIRWLDALCEQNAIELVPNQNCFGHMEQWLRHPAYQHLAECPNGFEHPFSGWKSSGSVLRPGEESARFIDGLLSELLPCFSSDQVNIGCDETWELGQGASAEVVRQSGRRAVFTRHLKRLLEIVQAHGKHPQFWADVFLGEEDASLPRIPGATPVIWGYEPGHPFTPAISRLKEAGYPFLVAPGTSCWNSFGGRWPTALANIREALEICQRFGGDGFLLTSWGDNGHGYPFATMIPSIVCAGLIAHQGTCTEVDQIKTLQAQLDPGDSAAALALLELGSFDERAGSLSTNMSGLYQAALDIQVKGLAPTFTASPSQITAARICLKRIRTLMESASDSSRSRFQSEVQLAADLTEYALLQVAQEPIPSRLMTLPERFKADWEATSQSRFPTSQFSGLFPGHLG